MTDRLLVTSLLALSLLLALGGVSAAQDRAPKAAGVIQADLGGSITYQGSLTRGDAPVNAPHEMRFILYDSESGGSQVGDTETYRNVAVDNGVFTVALNFGSVFDGRALWLEVAVRPDDRSEEFTVLRPRQLLTAAPYALHSGGAWNLSGNAGTLADLNFIGTTDEQALVIRTNDREALRVGADGRVGVAVMAPDAGLEASSGTGAALMGTSPDRGVVGRVGAIPCPGPYAVGGCAGDSGAAGVFGWSTRGYGVYATSTSSSGLRAYSTSGAGVEAASESSSGVDARSQSGFAVLGTANTGRGVVGYSSTGIGVLGDAATRGVVGTLGRTSCAGEYAVGGCAGGAVAAGVFGQSNAAAIYAKTDTGDVFVGVIGPTEIHESRIDRNGKGYFNGGTQTGGADYAESMRTTDDPAALEPGDVLSLDPQSGYAVRLSREANSRLVAGVYSTRPSVLAVGEHGVDSALAGEVPVALLGVVPTKVTAANGPIQIGDLLVTSALPGRAMKAKPDMVNGVPVYPTGAILGKALEPLLSGTGMIKVLVTLR